MKLEMSKFYGYRGDQWQENAWSYKKCSIIPLSDLTHLVIPHLVEAKKTEMNLMTKLSCFVDTPVEDGASADGWPISDFPMGKSVGHILDCKVMVEGLGNCGQCHPQAGLIGMHEKRSWTWILKQSKETASPMASVSVPFPKVSAVSSFSDFSQWWTITYKKKINPLLYNLLWSWWFSQQHKTDKGINLTSGEVSSPEGRLC